MYLLCRMLVVISNRRWRNGGKEDGLASASLLSIYTRHVFLASYMRLVGVDSSAKAIGAIFEVSLSDNGCPVTALAKIMRKPPKAQEWFNRWTQETTIHERPR